MTDAVAAEEASDTVSAPAEFEESDASNKAERTSAPEELRTDNSLPRGSKSRSRERVETGRAKVSALLPRRSVVNFASGVSPT